MWLPVTGLVWFGLLSQVPAASFSCSSSPAAADASQLASAFAAEVDRRLDVPPAEQRLYSDMLPQLDQPQYVVVVDRSVQVQAALIFLASPGCAPQFIGASPVSTGKVGSFDHFLTPLGVFPHSLDNPDFRALGTRNELGIRGYGLKDMRVFDFGWQESLKGWGKGGTGVMRLQMHATDPDILEKRLGTAQSKGCIRIPATLNLFIDRHGILDGDYDDAIAAGSTFWVLSKSREPTPWSGRYLIVVETRRSARPSWAALPGKH
jgi:hypothetical protein